MSKVDRMIAEKCMENARNKKACEAYLKNHFYKIQQKGKNFDDRFETRQNKGWAPSAKHMKEEARIKSAEKEMEL